VKIARYELQGEARFGFVIDDHVIDAASVEGVSASSVRELIAGGALPDLGAVAAAGPGLALGEVQLLPPVEPGKIVCAGVNFHTHREEAGQATVRPDHPTIFTRYADSVVGHGSDLLKPDRIQAFDYEGELAVIIGGEARNVSEGEAGRYVFGYACFNDGSARDWQQHSGQWAPGKNFHQSGGFGPWIVTADETGDLDDAELVTRVNGEVRQSARIKDMVFSVAELIAYTTAFTPLSPGDVIAAGTPGGVGFFSDPQRLLEIGDVVEVEIAGLGTLRNQVQRPT
jgi:2-keto-4-pentenoate hydratase/2-oxohepta-3-ene-1,7-dioic acid hydratase in catechol pathway